MTNNYAVHVSRIASITTTAILIFLFYALLTL